MGIRTSSVTGRRPGGLVIVLMLIVGSVIVAPSQTAAVLPAGFTDELVTSLGGPTALAFTPDGRLLITTQGGQLRIYQSGALLATPALDISAKVCANSERGLLGVTVDPAFASNGYIYIYYTFKKFNVCDTNTATVPVNRVSRFVLGASNVVDPATEAILVDNIPSTGGNHNAGDVQFGHDEYLYVSVGDGGCDYAGGGCAGANDAARDRHVLLGKILRITRDGAIPPGNPFLGAGTVRCSQNAGTPGQICQETFAWGLRNPFRIAFDPNVAGTRFFINDVGQNTWEEIDLGTAGADYGWNVREGFCATGSTTNCGPPPQGMTNPIFSYGRADGCASITGGAFVPASLWPAEYEGEYLFADYVCGKIFRLHSDGVGYTRADFATGLGSSSAVHLIFGPRGTSQALYYTTYAGGGQVRRIYFTAGNGVPTAVIAASPTSGPAPLTVAFDGGGSSDPDGDALTAYMWDFGDGQSTTTTTAQTSHTYTVATPRTATLRVQDARGAISAPASVNIAVGNTAPVPSIQSPAATDRFAVGQTITLVGSATDAQDGPLPASSLSWTVLRHHDTHTHPWFQGTGNNLTFQAPGPEDLAATTNSYLEIQLAVTDSGGLTGTTTRNVQPRAVAVTLASNPTGLNLTVNGTTVRAPATITSWEGYRLDLSAPSQQGNQKFQSWSDGGAQAHSVITPASPLTYTAAYSKKGRPK